MSANSIIRKFNIEEDVFYLENENNLYFKLLLDTEEIKRKKAVFCKICIDRKSSLDDIRQDSFSKLQNKAINKNKPNRLKQWAFEYNPIETNFSGDEIFREYLFSLPLDIINQILENDPQHIFSIYFLNKNKNIIEFYSYSQNESSRITDYKIDSGELFESLSSKSEFLEDNIDFIIREYNDSFSLGPTVQVSDLFKEFPGNEDYKDNISIKIAFKARSYEYNNIFQSNFSLKLIEDYKSGIIFDLYEDLLLLDETSKTIILEYSYLDNVVIVEKTIAKSLILSLYASYYKKHKAFFIRETFFGKISIQISSQDIFDTIMLDPCDTKYLEDFDADLSKFKIKKNNDLFIDKLFTLINLEQDSAIFGQNNLFSYSSIFGQAKKIYFIRKTNGNVSYTLYYDNIEIINNDSISNPEDNQDSYENLNDSILGGQVFSETLQNPRFNGRRIISELNTAIKKK